MKALNNYELDEETGTPRREDADETTSGAPPYCNLPDVPPPFFPEVADPLRERLIIAVHRKWNNGTVLHYHFLDSPGVFRGSDADKDAVRHAFDVWKSVGIGLEFHEVDDPREAEIRIGFQQGDGSWSYVGRDAIDHVQDHRRRTMNFGWSLTTDWGRETALHEIGHAMGFYHEHQNPNAGIEWDEAAVLDTFAGSPNFWDEATIRRNILDKRSPTEAQGSEWDPDSIMHYPFEPGLVRRPDEYRINGITPAPGLSALDQETALFFYPSLAPSLPKLKRFLSERLMIAAGQQLDFRVKPPANGDYTFMTFGPSDTVLVLFEEIDGERRFLAGDDDSGTDRNAFFTARMIKDRKYVLSVRLYFAHQQGSCAVTWF